MDFQLKSEYIELDSLLKALELAADGAEAKHIIQSNVIKVNGEVEIRIRRKLRPGDYVEFPGQRINVVQ